MSLINRKICCVFMREIHVCNRNGFGYSTAIIVYSGLGCLESVEWSSYGILDCQEENGNFP